MSYELAAILVVGVVMGLAQAAAIVTAVSGFGAMAREMDRTRGEVNRGFEAMDRRFEQTRAEANRRFEETQAEANRSFEETRAQMNRGFEELSRTHRVIAALIVQESEKIQTLLRP